MKPDRDWARRSERRATSGNARAARGAMLREALKREAKEAGATLKNGGKGGLNPALALLVFRRDEFTCRNEDCPDPKKDLDLDHISGHAREIEEDPKARKNPDLKKGVDLGHVDIPEALHVICAACHDAVHEREREIEEGEDPDPMPGDSR